MNRKLLVTLTVFVVMVIVIINWKSILLYAAGVKKPKIESTDEIIGYASKLEQTEFVAISSSKDNFIFLQSNFGVPGLIVFNDHHYPIKSSHGTNCPDVARQFLTKLNDGTTFPADYSNLSVKKIEDILSKVTIIKGDSLQLDSLISSGAYRYIVIYSWAKYMPRQSRKMIRGVQEFQLSGNNILFISLNLDYSSKWAKNEKISF